MQHAFFTRRSLALIVTVSGLATGLAASSALAASAPIDTSGCANPQLSQPFASIKDSSWYSLAPGQSLDNFTGAGWTLSGGAGVVTTTLLDGSTGLALDLPSGATAVSPVICVTNQYPTARMQVRDLVGSEGVSFNVEYLGTNTANSPKNTGQVHGQGSAWSNSDKVNLQPAGGTGWQEVRVVLTGKGTRSHFQVSNLYIDPRCV